MSNKTLGILGLGSQSTLFYIRELNAIFNKKNRGYSTCPFKLLNIDFDAINNLLPAPSKKLDTIVKSYVNELIKLDIDTILVPNITLHETIDRLKIRVPIIHPIHYTVSELKKKNYKKVVLFGSNYTMESSYIKSIFAENGIEVLLPSKKDMKFTDEVRKQVYQETATQDLLNNFNLTIKKYAQSNVVVIACTELSISSTNGNLRILDMARIQINQAVNEIKKNFN